MPPKTTGSTLSVAYVTNSPAQSGMGKPAREVVTLLKKQPDLDIRELSVMASPASRLPKPLQWWRASHRLPRHGFDLWHFTNQTLSFIPRRPAVVTVYDIIELLEPQVTFGRPVARALYRGLPHAAHLICVSHYTKQTLQAHYRIPDEKITVIPLAVANVFRPDANAQQSVAYHQFLAKHELTPQQPLMLYVGSEHPRKNLRVVVEALARVRRQLPDVVLLKVGDPGVAAGRQRLLADLDRLNLRSAVRVVGRADDQTLNMLYNIAGVFVFPTTFEGFGIPPLEAMASGCPVVCSNATSVPEVVGDAAILHDPSDVTAFADSIYRVLTTPALAADLRQRGLARAQKFSWESVATQTANVYRKFALHS